MLQKVSIVYCSYKNKLDLELISDECLYRNGILLKVLSQIKCYGLCLISVLTVLDGFRALKPSFPRSCSYKALSRV